METYKSLPDNSDEISFSDAEDQGTQEGEPISLIGSQIEILRQIFSFGQAALDDDDPNLEVGDH